MSTLPLTAPELAAVDDLGLFAEEVASDLEALKQDVYHVLIETPGSNPDDVERGVGIDDLLSSPTTKLTGLTRIVEEQLQRDERIDGARAELVQIQPGGSLPDGTTLPAGGYLLEIEVIVGESVVPLSFLSTGTGGLVPV